MVGLDPVVGLPLGSVPRRRERLLEHDRVGRCSVGDDLQGVSFVVPMAWSKNQ
jgi:hypothetical protein